MWISCVWQELKKMRLFVLIKFFCRKKSIMRVKRLRLWLKKLWRKPHQNRVKNLQRWWKNYLKNLNSKESIWSTQTITLCKCWSYVYQKKSSGLGKLFICLYRRDLFHTGKFAHHDIFNGKLIMPQIKLSGAYCVCLVCLFVCCQL